MTFSQSIHTSHYGLTRKKTQEHEVAIIEIITVYGMFKFHRRLDDEFKINSILQCSRVKRMLIFKAHDSINKKRDNNSFKI